MELDRDANQQEAIAALTGRVAALERQLAEMTRLLPVQPKPPPPPVPSIPAEAVAFPATGHESQDVSQPTPVAVKPVLSAAQTSAHSSLEDRLGSQIFNLVGILAVIVGTSWALKLAFERGWIGAAGRVIIGLAAGVGLVLWSETFRRKRMQAFSYSLKAVATGVLYLSLWAAFQLYHLLPANVALAAMVLVTAWNAYMAWSQDAELLVGYALIGGFTTPLLLATGGDHEGFLFTYLAGIDLATAVLIRRKPWRRLLLPAFAATVAYFIGWYTRFFHTETTLWNAQSTETVAFIGVFFVIFALVSLKRWNPNEPSTAQAGEVIVPVLIPLANAAFVSLTLYSVLQDSGLHSSLAWLMVALAAIYLLLMRLQASVLAAAMHLAMAAVFLTIAIPLKASGHTLTTAWLVEGLVLYWASTRMGSESRAPSLVLSILAKTGFALGLLSLVFRWFLFNDMHGFFNANLGAAVVALVALGAAAWLACNAAGGTEPPPERPYDAYQFAIGLDVVAVLLTLREIASGWFSNSRETAFANSNFATALIGLAALAGVALAASRLARAGAHYKGFGLVSAGNQIAFHLIAIVCVVREIGALFTSGDAGVQRSLAISGFLMLYGAALLAAGFWRRTAFVRWQGLILLVFTILKVFLYDVSGLSQGYRVASFLSLGALLMGVSFAYQKNWLGLRDTGGLDSGRNDARDVQQ